MTISSFFSEMKFITFSSKLALSYFDGGLSTFLVNRFETPNSQDLAPNTLWDPDFQTSSADSTSSVPFAHLSLQLLSSTFHSICLLLSIPTTPSSIKLSLPVTQISEILSIASLFLHLHSNLSYKTSQDHFPKAQFSLHHSPLQKPSTASQDLFN